MYNLLIKKIKEKKPLDRLDDAYIAEKIASFIKQNPKLAKKTDFTNEKNNGFNTILKAVRNELNKTYGIFWLRNKIELEAHKSSKERISFYKQLYRKIFAIIGTPESILDISAGLNPLSLPFMNFKGKYTATELTRADCNLLNNYFRKNNINGRAIQQDITRNQKFPEADVVFLFKVFDSVEAKGHKLAEEIIRNLNAKYAVVSFATETACGKKMNFPKRGWIEQLLKRLNLKYKKLGFENEVFYVVELTNSSKSTRA